MSEAKRVFCKDCKHRRIYKDIGWGAMMILDGIHCQAEPAIVAHPINGNEPIYAKCVERNAEMDCSLFEAKPAPIAPVVTTKPWWRFWE